MLCKPDSPEFPNSLRLLLHFWIDNEDLDVADDDKLPEREKENESEEDKDEKEKESEADKRERKKGSLEQKKNNSFYFVSTVNTHQHFQSIQKAQNYTKFIVSTLCKKPPF